MFYFKYTIKASPMVLISPKITSSGSMRWRFGLVFSRLNFSTELYKEDFDFLQTAINFTIPFQFRISNLEKYGNLEIRCFGENRKHAWIALLSHINFQKACVDPFFFLQELQQHQDPFCGLKSVPYCLGSQLFFNFVPSRNIGEGGCKRATSSSGQMA